MEKQNPTKVEFEIGIVHANSDDQGTPENNLGFKGELDKLSPKSLQYLETVKPKEEKEEKLFLSSDELGIKNIISEQLYNNIIAENTSTQMLFENSSDIPLLSRINRLDIVLDYLEDTNLSGGSTKALPAMDGEKSAMSEMVSDDNSLEKRCKPISWVLEEAEAKGTIMERVAVLEDRVKRIREELERRNSCDQAIKSNGTEAQMHNLHLNGSNGCEIVLEDEKQKVGVIPSESRQKGLHEDASRRIISQAEDINKDNNNHPMNKDDDFPKHNNMEEERAKEKNQNQSRGKGKLRRMFPGCIFLHSH
ncbi:hypothetical protein SUGI_0411440 [Cryptomeria japonica]|uniref:uncharacterized protein LOC131031244 n=1 Tax=Cryptomeria japonica TaxID=3369 RepID=UPI002408B6DA|nr:uncharacterized protein LOC131031244 [Cryptomeria japonica]XP_057818283.1 uncharacterized protein LOC131031244 [Cryptomeria japonica]GLJ21968.1 hypothetical protein SUGI_0411440 [Cryptomeria japonica]